MKEDIFASYIERQIKGQRTQKTSYSHDIVSDDSVLEVLKEISGKLDRVCASTVTSNTAASVMSSCQADIAIINGKVVIPDSGVFDMDIYVKNGKISSMVNRLSTDCLSESCMSGHDRVNASRVIDATGRYVIPGIIDPHVHIGLFVPVEEDLKSETKSAILGGVTTVGCFFGSSESHLKTLPEIAGKIRDYSYIDFIPHLVIGNDLQRREIGDYIKKLGVTSFKLYMNGIPGMIPDIDDGFSMDVFDEIKKSDKKCIVCVHAENRYLVRRALRMKQEEEPDATVEAYSDTHPAMAEEEAVIRMSYLAEKSRVPVYFVHITSKDAVRRLGLIRSHNRFVNVETTGMYLTLSRQDEKGRNEFKMDPPFRDEEDVDGLWQALEDGTIDTIGTDNTTITRAEKKTEKNMWETLPGYPAEETYLASLLDEGVVKRSMPIEKLITHMTKKPAQMFGVYPQKGTLLPGSDADIVIVDMEKTVEVHASELHSRSDFSVFEGKKLKGWPVVTIKGGRVAAENGRLTAEAPGGRCLKR